MNALRVGGAAEAARFIRSIGLDPELARVSVDGGVHVFEVRDREGTPRPLRFTYDGRGSTLSADELTELSVALVRSVPTRFEILGVDLLSTIERVCDEAAACRAERLALGAPKEDLDAHLAVLRAEVADAKRAVSERDGDLAIPPSAFALPEGLRAAIPEPPYPVLDLLPLRDQGLMLVVDSLPERKHWGMFRHEDGAALMVRVVDDQVLKQDLIEGPAAIEPWARFGTYLTDEASHALRWAFYPGLTHEDGVARARDTGLELRPLIKFDAGNGRETRLWIVDQKHPRRRQVLFATIVDGQGVLCGRWLVQGPAAIDQLARALKRAIFPPNAANAPDPASP